MKSTFFTEEIWQSEWLGIFQGELQLSSQCKDPKKIKNFKKIKKYIYIYICNPLKVEFCPNKILQNSLQALLRQQYGLSAGVTTIFTLLKSLNTLYGGQFTFYFYN